MSIRKGSRRTEGTAVVDAGLGETYQFRDAEGKKKMSVGVEVEGEGKIEDGLADDGEERADGQNLRYGQFRHGTAFVIWE